jgi:PrgI family protein
MAVYKVLQDVEAEDKFIGPLTLKQFIFAGITAVCLYLGFFFVTKNLWYLAVPLLPVIGVGAFLAFPWGRDQPTEVWLLAKLRFYFKPRKRIWDQTGVQHLVTVTAPKNSNMQYVNNITQTEVKSRLKALAETIDSRGWAVKNVNLNMFSPQLANAAASSGSDRLLDASVLPHEVSQVDVMPSDDIMDAQNNPLAQQLDAMISKSQQTHRQAALEKMHDVNAGSGKDQPMGLGAPAPNYWFVNQPDPATTPMTIPGDNTPLTAEEKALLDQLHEEQARAAAAPISSHLKVIEPLSGRGKQKAKKPTTPKSETKSAKESQAIKNPPPPPMTPPPDPAILNLAINNDLSVASLAREANNQLNPPTEVVINLH